MIKWFKCIVWTSLLVVPRKAVKFNHSLTYSSRLASCCGFLHIKRCPSVCPSVPPSILPSIYHSIALAQHMSYSYLVQSLTLIGAWTLLIMGFLRSFLGSNGTFKFYEYTAWLASWTRPAEGSCPLDGIFILCGLPTMINTMKLLHDNYLDAHNMLSANWFSCGITLKNKKSCR